MSANNGPRQQTNALSQKAYAQGVGTTQTNYAFVTDRDPTNLDVQFAPQIGKWWINNSDSVNPNLFYVASYSSVGGYLQANWILVATSGTGNVASLTVDANTAPGTNPVLPTASGTITITGNQVTAGSIGSHVIRTDSLAANTFTIEIQKSSAVAASDSTKNGVAHFNSSQFTVDADAFVSLSGGGQAIDSVQVDAATAPGTNPVVPTAAGLITVTGAQVATGVIGANVIRTNSLAANTYTVQVQRSTAVAATDSTKNGVSHFNSAQFSVDSNGFVSSISGANNVVRQVFTVNGTYTPTAGMKQCDIQMLGGGGAGGGAPATGVGELSTGSGGGGGEYALGIFTAVTIGASQAITIGSGGTGVSGTTGNAGTATSVGALLTANGGQPGLAVPASASVDFRVGGLGGTGGTGGDVHAPGQNGQQGTIYNASAGGGLSGSGGNSQFGAGGARVVTTVGSHQGQNGLGYGAGGQGSGLAGSQSAIAGGNGSAGIVIITEYI